VLPLLNRAFQIAGTANTPDILWQIQNTLRRNLARDGQTDLAIFFGKQAVNTIQILRTNLTSQDEDTEASFLRNRNKTRVYRELADLLIDQGRLPEAQQILSMLKEEELYDFLRRSQTDDNRNTRTGYTPAEETWQKRYQEISGRLGEISRALEELDAKARTGLSAEETAKRDQLRADRRVAQQSFEGFLGKLMREMDTATAQRNREVGERGLVNLRTLQDTLASLGHHAVAVHYLMGDNKLRMILTTPTLQIARESAITSTQLNRKIQEFQTLLSTPRSNPRPLAEELFKHLIEPIAVDLKQAKAQTLMVSLDGAMRYIPLAALHDGKK
jgi:CHAT domain-containing protein